MPQRSRGPLILRLVHFDPFWWIDADTRAVEALSGLIALTFAIVLLWPGSLFAQLAGYRVMAALLPENAWGGILLFQWLIQSLAMCGNVRFLRFPSAICAFLLWILIGICFWLVQPQTLSSYLFFWMAIFMAWVILKGPTDGDG